MELKNKLLKKNGFLCHKLENNMKAKINSLRQFQTLLFSVIKNLENFQESKNLFGNVSNKKWMHSFPL